MRAECAVYSVLENLVWMFGPESYSDEQLVELLPDGDWRNCGGL